MNQEDMRKEFEVWQEIGQFNGTSAAILWAVWQAATQAQHDKHQAEIAMLREKLSEAAEDIADWGAYASTYFQEKWDLAGDIAKYTTLSTPPTQWLENKLAEQREKDAMICNVAEFNGKGAYYCATAIRNKEKAE